MGPCSRLRRPSNFSQSLIRLQYKGQEGVELAIKILMQELAITMRLAG